MRSGAGVNAYSRKGHRAATGTRTVKTARSDQKPERAVVLTVLQICRRIYRAAAVRRMVCAVLWEAGARPMGGVLPDHHPVFRNMIFLTTLIPTRYGSGRRALSASRSFARIGICWGQCASHLPHPMHWEAKAGAFVSPTVWAN